MFGVLEGTGVATYADVLARCLVHAGAVPVILNDQPQSGGGRRSRAARWLSALDPRARLARMQHLPLAADQPKYTTTGHVEPGDIFREAQVFFTLHGRLMPVVCVDPPQVMHWTYPVPLYVQGARNLYTVHDVIPLSHPELTPISRSRHDRLLRLIAAQADGLVTVSESARRAVIAQLGCNPAAVFNTYQAVLDAPDSRADALPNGLTPGGYFLFCGTVERRKNLAALVKAHAKAKTGMPLVIAGPVAPGHAALEARLRAAPGVIRLEWQPRDALIGLMRDARALLFPSLVEGFGLPVAEAMSLGVPVMTSDHGALAEIAGGAARLVDPGSGSDMVNAIKALAGDDLLCARLKAAGLERARLFSPHAYGQRLHDLYSSVLGVARPTPRTAAAHA